nr:leucine-rich repeat protein [Tanacetum cinerariifolium]
MNSPKATICLSSSSRISFLFYCLAIICLTSTTVSVSYGGNETDHLVLLSFKSKITQDPYQVLTSWNHSFHFCDWSGISCGKRHKRVIALRLGSKGLEGSLSTHVGNLSFLRELYLRNNSFQGTIPHELGRLSRLRILYLNRNKFRGVIPTNLSSCSHLEDLWLDRNELAGSIPKEMSLLSKLVRLEISKNKLTGGIPPFLGNITSMEVFSARGNPLGGSIPDTLGHWKILKEFYCGDCNLYGSIPHSIFNLSLLVNFSLSTNHLTGSLPSEIGVTLPNLEWLQLRNNELTGVLPTPLSNCSKLGLLEMVDNNFSGKLTIDFSKLSDIKIIRLGNNNLNGLREADDMRFIDSLKNCTKLVELELLNCNLIGVLPISIGNLSFLRELYLRNNSFQGTIPHELGRLSRLRILYLNRNKFRGVIPTNLSGCSNLEDLWLDRNELAGSIPKEMSLLSKLASLEISKNKLTGGIPPFLGNITSMEVFSARGNPLGGSIPDTLGVWKSLKEFYCGDCNLYGSIPHSIFNLSLLFNFSLSTNHLIGSLPSEIGVMLPNLEWLQLRNNELTGVLPPYLSNCSKLGLLEMVDNHFSGKLAIDFSKLSDIKIIRLGNNNLNGRREADDMRRKSAIWKPPFKYSLAECISLITLKLLGNQFQGIIPSSLSSLGGLETLDISQNNLSSKIPQFLDNLKSLEYLNLSFNDFEGEVPVVGVFANASAFSVLGNHRLCGGLVTLVLPKCKKRGGLKIRFILFIVIAPMLLIVLSCVYLLCKKKCNSQPSHSLGSERFMKVSYNQLLKATDGFSVANLIGEGRFSSVYKGILDFDDDKSVAIKVLHLQNRGAHKSFQAECKAWRNIRHRNDFKALVYEFMPSGSLHDWLHSNANASKLNLLQRVNILRDVATALDYLHNCCQTTIVHGDMKPSNILLDADMVAHVGDVGLARLLGTDLNQNSSTGIKGTIGYAPPGSGDVYSFGILLLEVMTGKRPTDDMFNEGLSLYKFAYMALPDHVIDVIDDDAIELQSTEANAKKVEECLVATITIGVSCSVDSPAERMKIEIVVNELQRILHVFQNI